MSPVIEIVEGPVPRSHDRPGDDAAPPPGTGAEVSFEGIVREIEDGRRIAALDYELYEPMATRELERLAGEVMQSRGLISMSVVHSRGRVPAGACSFRLVIRAPHRAEALRAMEEFIDRMKRDVPIWKRPVWA